jgi:hypothetical protein
MVSRPDADGRNSGRSLGARKAVPGASGLLGMLTRTITLDERPAAPLDEADAPDVVLFDPEEYPNLPEGSRPYAKVLVDKFIAAKLRPHQVLGVGGNRNKRRRCGRELPPVGCGGGWRVLLQRHLLCGGVGIGPWQ